MLNHKIRDDKIIAILAISVIVGTLILLVSDVITVNNYTKETDAIKDFIKNIEDDDDGFVDLTQVMAKNSKINPKFDDLSKLKDYLEVLMKDRNNLKSKNSLPLNSQEQILINSYSPVYKKGIEKSKELLNDIANLDKVAYAFVIAKIDERCILVVTSGDHFERLTKIDFSHREYCKKINDGYGVNESILTDTYLSNGLGIAVRTSMIKIENDDKVWYLGITMNWTENMVSKHKDKFHMPNIDIAFVDNEKNIHSITPLRGGEPDYSSLTEYGIDPKIEGKSQKINLDEFKKKCGFPDGKWWRFFDDGIPSPPETQEEIPLKMIACYPHHNLSSIMIEITMLVIEIWILFVSGHSKYINSLIKSLRTS